MIQLGFFKDQMGRLGAAFGYSGKRLDDAIPVYHEALEIRISEPQLMRTVEHLLVNGDKFPTIKAMLEVARMFPDAQTPQQLKSCSSCGGTGIIRARDKDGYKPIFKCPDCENCQANYPVWNDELFQRGYSREVVNVGWNEYDPLMIKGLVAMGPRSIVWKKATLECRAAAQRLLGNKAHQHGSVGEAMTTMPDAHAEAARARNIAADRKSEQVFDR